MPAPKGHPSYNINREGRPKKYTKEFIEKEAAEFLLWMEKKDSIWFERFAVSRGYNPDLLSMWAKENEIFHGVYKISQAWQKMKLIEGGLLNRFNSAIVKLVLSNTIGWTDKQQISGSAENPLQFLIDQSDGSSKDLVEDER